MASKAEYALQIAIGGKIASSFNKAVGGSQKELSKLQGAASKVGKGVAVGFGLAVTAIAAVGKELVDLGSAFDDAYDAIRIGTGATGEELAALEESMNNVYTSVPASMEDCSTAITEYNTRLDLTGEALETLSTQALQASEMLGEDLGGMIESSSQAFQQWGVAEEDMAGSMDYIFKVAQSTGTEMTTLFTELQKFGPQMQEMGYSFEEAAALMGQLDKAGVNTNEVLGAMKKSVGAMAKEGIKASDGFEMYCDRIKNAATETEAASIASEVFGSRAGTTMASAIRDGTLSVEDFTAALQENQDTISGVAWDTYDFPEQLEMMKHQAEVAIQPLASELFGALSDIMGKIDFNKISELISTIVDAMGPVFDSVLGYLPGIIDTVMSFVEMITPIYQNLMGYMPSLLDIIMQIFNMVAPYLPQIFDALNPIIDAIMVLLDAVLTPLLPVLQPIMDLIVALLPILTAVGDLIVGLSPIISQVISVAVSVIGGFIDFLMPIVDGTIQIFQGIIDFITNVFAGNWAGAWEGIKEAFSGVWNNIKAICGGAINLIIRIINGLIDAINKIKVGPLPNWKILGQYAGATIGFNIAHIPEVQFAEGGIVTEPTHALIGEAGESEAVIPLSKLNSMISGGLGGGDMNITFAPVINCSSGDPRQVEEATEAAFDQFKTFMDQYLKQNRRVQFSRV